jgi:hypothetical protein
MRRRQTNASNVPIETEAEFEFDECPANDDAEGAHLLAGRRVMAAKVRLGFYIHLYASCVVSRLEANYHLAVRAFYFGQLSQQEKIIVKDHSPEIELI